MSSRATNFAGPAFHAGGNERVRMPTRRRRNPPPRWFLGPHGGHVQVSGHVVCAEGAVADLRVTITQRGTGAVAEGTTRIACTGHEAPWEIQGATVGRGAFSAGPATACGLLEVNGQNDPPDAFQWCRDEIELLEP